MLSVLCFNVRCMTASGKGICHQKPSEMQYPPAPSRQLSPKDINVGVRGMMWAIIICTILYIVIALVLTGMVHYNELNVGDPLAFVFEKLDLKWMSGIIAVSAVIAMASVLLVFQMGQPRIWMSMSRDGLLPKKFSRVHPKFKTPSYATVVTGFVVAIPALFLRTEVPVMQ